MTDENDVKLILHARSREQLNPGSEEFKTLDKKLEWSTAETAIIICDMWDKHWCKGATKRVAGMATRMNNVVNAARQRGVTIIHCPSETMEFYEDHLARKLMQNLLSFEAPVPIKDSYCLDSSKEPPLPIDDSDEGCDCEPKCKKDRPWKRQIATIEIKDGDGITDNGQEVFNLCKYRGIKNLVIMGVHTNMCVLRRPFGIRNMTTVGMNMTLVRDLTDTMYNHRMRPCVPHDRGTELVIEHIEKYWCPSVLSEDLVHTHGPIAE